MDRHSRAKPRCPVLPSCLGVPVVVIQGPHCWFTLLPQLLPPQLLLPLLPAHPSSAWCPSHHSPLEMLSTVTPSSPVRTPTLRKNVQTTSSLTRWSSIAVAPSMWIYEVQQPSERVSSLAVIQVHSWGISDGLPSPLPPLPLTLGLQSQKSNALHVDARILGLVPQQFLSVSSSHSASTVAATMCTNKLTQRITYLSHPIGTVWQPDTVHSQVGIGHFNWTSARRKYMLNLLVSWECPDGPSGSPVEPVNPGYKITTISIEFLKTLCVCHRMGKYLSSHVGVYLMKLNRVGVDGTLSSLRSDLVVRSGDNCQW